MFSPCDRRLLCARLDEQGETATGDFAPFLNGPKYTVTDPWLRAWLDALAFSLSGVFLSLTPYLSHMSHPLFPICMTGISF